MYEWYCKENVDYVDSLIEKGEVPIYWNDVDCYYWAPSVVLPSGNVCDFFCRNNQYAPKHHPWDLTYIINPTMEQAAELERMKEEERQTKAMEVQKKRQETCMRDRMSETSVLLGRCVQALKYLDTEHQKYFK